MNKASYTVCSCMVTYTFPVKPDQPPATSDCNRTQASLNLQVHAIAHVPTRPGLAQLSVAAVQAVQYSMQHNQQR